VVIAQRLWWTLMINLSEVLIALSTIKIPERVPSLNTKNKLGWECTQTGCGTTWTPGLNDAPFDPIAISAGPRS